MKMKTLVKTDGLRLSHFRQLLSYIEHQERDGWYYGNKEQFMKRHEDLRLWVEIILEDPPLNLIKK